MCFEISAYNTEIEDRIIEFWKIYYVIFNSMLLNIEDYMLWNIGKYISYLT